MRNPRYGICTDDNCGSWGLAPKEFRESKHFLRCACGKPMYLTMFNPREAGYSEKKQILSISVMNQE
jgi:hypothetical protein